MTVVREGKDWQVEMFDPIELIHDLFGADAPTDHITFDPFLKSKREDDRTYFRAKNGGGDGAFIYVRQDMAKILLPFLTMQTWLDRDAPDGDLSAYRGIRYRIGPLFLYTVYGHIKLRCSETMKFPGERYRIRIFAQADLIKKEIAA